MIVFQRTSYGLRVNFIGEITYTDFEDWILQLHKVCVKLSEENEPFGSIFDFSRITSFDPEIGSLAKRAQLEIILAGELRVGIIYFTTAQIIEVPGSLPESVKNPHRRYICSDLYPDYENRAFNWIMNGLEP